MAFIAKSTGRTLLFFPRCTEGKKH